MSTRVLVVGVLLAVAAFAVAYYVTRKPEELVTRTTPASSSSTSTDETDRGKTEPKKPVKPLLEGWDKPAAALMLTGEMHGYLEPCGCTAGQYGGLARRGDLATKLRARGWPLAGFDLGDLIRKPTRKQAMYKLTSALRSLRQIGYEAVGVGIHEVEFDPGQFVSRDETEKPFLVSANVAMFAGDPVEVRDVVSQATGRKPWVLSQVGDVKVAVTSVFGQEYTARTLGASGKKGDLAAVDPVAALKVLLPTMQEAKPDLMLLLSNCTVEESKRLAQQFPEFQIVVTAGGPEEPRGQPIMVGQTMLLTVGAKGRHAGIVGYYPRAGQKLKFELVDLDGDRFEHMKQIDENMQLYQDDLKNLNIAKGETPVAYPGKGNIDGSNLAFVGAVKCGECHTRAFAKWKDTGHARAYDSLIHGRKGEKNPIARNHDPECLSCHVVGWDPAQDVPYRTGYLFELAVKDRKGKEYLPDLRGQQCENCHGPGSQHVAAEQAFRKGGKLTQEVRDWRSFMHNDLPTAKQQICVRCHDIDNSPEFHKEGAFEKYWEKIRHPGRD